METFVVVMTLMGTVRAHGPFESERVCWQWIGLLERARQFDWFGTCVTMKEFRREFPKLRIEEDS